MTLPQIAMTYATDLAVHAIRHLRHDDVWTIDHVIDGSACTTPSRRSSPVETTGERCIDP